MIGAGIARGVRIRGLDCAVRERGFLLWDERPLNRLIHGGLQYLMNYDFGLVREGLKGDGLHLGEGEISQLPTSTLYWSIICPQPF